MVESLSNPLKEQIDGFKEIKEYIPFCLDKMEHTGEGKVDIFEPIIRREDEGLTEFQKEVLVENYGISSSEISNIKSWETFENTYLNYDTEQLDKSDIGKNCPVENGEWEGERGGSKWVPDAEYAPLKKNPEQKTWEEILDEYGIDGIEFNDGEPDFNEITKGDVEIEPFSTNRDDNFDKADIELAKQKGCSPEDVEKWRKDNGYTWHECKDMKTMQKVPSIVHNNISHRGGISEAKGGY